MRTASRVDANQASIVRSLRAVGASVLHVHQLKNCFDILVGYRGRTFLMEVKDPAQQTPADRRRGQVPGRVEGLALPHRGDGR